MGTFASVLSMGVTKKGTFSPYGSLCSNFCYFSIAFLIASIICQDHRHDLVPQHISRLVSHVCGWFWRGPLLANCNFSQFICCYHFIVVFHFFHFRTFIQIREKSDYFSSPKTSPIFWMWFLIKTFPSRYVFAVLSAGIQNFIRFRFQIRNKPWNK